MRAVFALENVILYPNLSLLGLRSRARLFDCTRIASLVDLKIVMPVSVLTGLLFLTFTPVTWALKD
jgi:hypothetical protein